MRISRFSTKLTVAAALLLFLSPARVALAGDGELQPPQTVSALTSGMQTASVPAGNLEAEIAREPDAAAAPGHENGVSASAQRLRDSNARAMIAALMALASSGGHPYPLLPR